jgi:tRNA-specific 2-thiouridylase
VLDISPVDRRVTVGPLEALDSTEVRGARTAWHGPAPTGPVEVHAQLSAHGAPVPAVAVADPATGTVVVTLCKPVRGVAPGQALVLYAGDRVVAAATVDR